MGFANLLLHPDITSWKTPGDFLFTAPEGGVPRSTNFRPRVFDPAAEKAGLPGLTPHERRHTAASLAIAAGANVKAVQHLLGHPSAAMTPWHLCRPLPDDLDTVASQLDQAFPKTNADQMRTNRSLDRRNQAVLPIEIPPGQASG